MLLAYLGDKSKRRAQIHLSGVWPKHAAQPEFKVGSLIWWSPTDTERARVCTTPTDEAKQEAEIVRAALPTLPKLTDGITAFTWENLHPTEPVLQVSAEEAMKKLESGELKPPQTCPLCEKPADSVGIFTPTPAFAKKIGQPLNKLRIVLYGGCSVCIGNLGETEYMRRIEMVLEADTLKLRRE